jgi:hypothetical protein
MSGARTASGLVCSHGSSLDTRIPRAKMPKSALPQSLRIKLGFEKRNPRSKQTRSRYSDETNPYAPGANVLKPRESADGKYKAGCQKNFLRRGSGSNFSGLAAQKQKQSKRNSRHSRSKAGREQLPKQHKHLQQSKVSKQCSISLNQIEDRLRDDYNLPTNDRLLY